MKKLSVTLRICGVCYMCCIAVTIVTISRSLTAFPPVFRATMAIMPTQVDATARRSRDSRISTAPHIFLTTAHFDVPQGTSLFRNPQLVLPKIERLLSPSYNDLFIESVGPTVADSNPQTFQRRVSENEENEYESYREDVLEASGLDSPLHANNWDDMDFPQRCVQPSWTYKIYPVCNSFHELAIDLPARHELQTFGSIRYLAHGYYRDSWLFQKGQEHTRHSDELVLKRLRMHHDVAAGSLKKVNTEAIIMERLSGSSATTNIHGHCAGSIFVETAEEITEKIVPYKPRAPEYQPERGRIDQAVLDSLQKHDVCPLNNLTSEERLEIAIGMAEGLAEMHGYVGGIITNDDVHPDQFLLVRGEDGKKDRIILNDMNNAVFLQWNRRKQEYCPYYIGYGGDYRAPEEFTDDESPIDESVDIWPFGNGIYGLLTGLWPYYNSTDERKNRKTMAVKGIPPHLDSRYRNRSLIEKRLAEIMDRCHQYKPKDRASIFEVLDHLRETKRLHEEKKELWNQAANSAIEES